LIINNFLLLFAELICLMPVYAAEPPPEGFTMFAGTRPNNLGVNAGKLAACPDKPNCVSSQVDAADAHFIAPIAYTAPLVEAMEKIKTIIISMPRVKIISSTENYVYAEFASKLMGFVDDTEFYIDTAAKLIHVRSASRLGYRDFNVNRERIEAIRQQLGKL
jgi:uncharacterized protein (DUF1499 family)